MVIRYEYYDGPEADYDNETFGKLQAQIITIGASAVNQSHVLTSVNLRLKKTGNPTGNAVVEIREVTGTNTIGAVLDTTTFDSATTGGTYALFAVTGFSGMTLLANTKYALILYHTTSDAENHIKWSGSNHTDDGNYTGGFGYHSEDNGVTWLKDFDTIDTEFKEFEIYGTAFSGTLCKYEDVIRKAGAGANATATDVGVVGNYVINAESVLNARTRENWTDLYTTLNTDVKYILGEIVSNLAAVKVINYDMSGYDSRLEAEGMKRTLMLEAEIYIQELKDKEAKDFIENA